MSGVSVSNPKVIVTIEFLVSIKVGVCRERRTEERSKTLDLLVSDYDEKSLIYLIVT